MLGYHRQNVHNFYITENGLRHASGPVPCKNPIRYIYVYGNFLLVLLFWHKNVAKLAKQVQKGKMAKKIDQWMWCAEPNG